jgi:hypothetical protein
MSLSILENENLPKLRWVVSGHGLSRAEQASKDKALAPVIALPSA